MTERLLNTREAAAFLGISAGTMHTWRSEGRESQPPFMKFGTKPKDPVRYRLADLEAWVEDRLVNAA